MGGHVLGSGTMAVVRLATNRLTGVEIAAKCLCSPDEELRQFTRDEYALMSELDHASIVRVIDLYENPSELWICMELCRNGCVQSYVEKNKVFDVAHGAALFQQLLQGLNYLHLKRFVHR